MPRLILFVQIKNNQFTRVSALSHIYFIAPGTTN